MPLSRRNVPSAARRRVRPELVGVRRTRRQALYRKGGFDGGTLREIGRELGCADLEAADEPPC